MMTQTIEDEHILMYKDDNDIKVINFHEFAENNRKTVFKLKKNYDSFSVIDNNYGNLIFADTEND